MKSISFVLARSSLLCLAMLPAAVAGPGGTYGPSGGSGYGPTYGSNYGTTGYRSTGGYNNSGYNSGYKSYGGGSYGGGYHGGSYGGGFGGGFSPQDDYRPTVIVGPQPPVKIVPPIDRNRDGIVDRPYFDRGGYPNNRPVVVTPVRPINGRDVYMPHRPTYYSGNGGWYHGDWHTNWNKSLTTRPYAWGGWNGGNIKVTSSVVSSPWRFGYWSYSNPYYTTTSNGPSYFNYSQPIITTNIAADSTGHFYPQAIGQSSREQAMQVFASARAAFFTGDLRAAQGQIDQAIAILPSDTVLHEFRALVLFARRDYNSAAGALYAVLSTGPGWNWTTLIGLYPNANIYTAHLRQLEDFCNVNPGVPHARFVLAYHYLTAGQADAAAEMYRQVLSINPRDGLSAQLLASLTGAGLSPVAQLTPAPGLAIDNRYLAGNWNATRNDGSSFQLSLRPDGSFSWTFTQQNGRREQMNGGYLLSDGRLILQQDGQPALVGQLIPQTGNRFIFKLNGGDPYDPGLTFYR